MNTETKATLNHLRTYVEGRAADQVSAMNAETRRYAIAVMEARREAFAEVLHVINMMATGTEGTK